MWAPLGLKSHFSLGEGTASPAEIVARLRADGIATAALADIGTLAGQVRFHALSRRAGIRPVTGVELRGVRGASGRGDIDGPPATRVVLLARSRSGYESLCRIVTRYRSSAAPDEADPARLLATSDLDGLFVLTDAPAAARACLDAGTAAPGDVRLLLVRPRPRRDETELRDAAVRLGVRLVADPDPVFLERADHRFHLLRASIHLNRTLAKVEATGEGRAPERHLPDPRALDERFSDVPEAVAETLRVAEACDFDLLDGALRLPTPRGAGPAEAHRRLERRVRERLREARERGRCRGEAYGSRLETELGVIRDRGLSGYFLAVGEILEEAGRRGVPVAGRGSAVGSLVAHLLGLSGVDPVASGLHFERFVHRHRRNLPDIDVDVSSARRDELVSWAHDHFGRDRVAMASAYHRFRRRSAWGEGAKALGLGPRERAAIGESLPPDELAAEIEEGRVRGATRDDLGPAPGLLTALPPDGPELVRRLIGRPRHMALHPGGLVVAPSEIDRLVPLEPAGRGLSITQFDADGLEHIGLAKIDLLGSRGLAEMEVALQHLLGTGEAADLVPALAREGPTAIPLDDPETLRLLDRADTVGCGQVETPAVRAVLDQVPIRRIEDLVAVLAVVRPGAAAGRAKARYIRRARGEEPAGRLDDVLAATHGVLLFEEDIMRVLSVAGGIGLEEADELRREIVERQDDPGGLLRLRNAFLRKASRSGGRPLDAEEAWDRVERFAAYSFNKAHAASYAVLAFQSAFLRRHAPVAFACGVLRHHGGSYPLRTIGAAIERWGVRIRLPHVNRSDAAARPERGGGAGPGAASGDRDSVRLGLSQVRGLTRRTGRRLLRARERGGSFATLEDVLARGRPSGAEVEALVLTGACDGLGPLEPDLYPFAHEAVVEAVRERRGLPRADVLVPRLREALAAEDPARASRHRALTRIRNELRFLRLHASAHPMAVLREEARSHGCATTTEAAQRAGENVRLAVLLAAGRRVVSSGGRVVRFLTLEDEEGLLEGVLQPARLRAVEERITTPGPYLVAGRVREERGHVHVDIRDMTPFHHRDRPRGGRSPGA